MTVPMEAMPDRRRFRAPDVAANLAACAPPAPYPEPPPANDDAPLDPLWVRVLRLLPQFVLVVAVFGGLAVALWRL